MPSLLGCRAVSLGVWFPLHRHIAKCGTIVITFNVMAQRPASYPRRLASRYLVWLNIYTLRYARFHNPEISVPFAQRCSPYWAVTYLKRRLHSPLSPPPSHLLQIRKPMIYKTFLRTTFAHLLLGFPPDLFCWNFPFRPPLGSFVLPLFRCDPPILVF